MTEYCYYIYAYLRADGTPYYIGKGKNKRATKNHGHNVRLPKDKSRIVIMESNLSEIGAFALERRYIKWYGRKDLETGILRNLTDGGEGPSGSKHTEEHKAKISAALKGRDTSEETRKKLSIAKKGKPSPRKGKKLPEATVQKMRGRTGSKSCMYGKPMPKDVKEKISIAMYGKRQKLLECPRCNKIGGSVMKRWHFDNCKLNKEY